MYVTQKGPGDFHSWKRPGPFSFHWLRAAVYAACEGVGRFPEVWDRHHQFALRC